MSNTTNQDTTTTEVETTPTVETTEAPPETKPETSPNHEAAKYRKQLREVEAERDTLKQSLVQYQQEAINHAISGDITLSFTPEEQRAGIGGSKVVVREFINGQNVPKNHTIPVSLPHPNDLFTIGGVDPADLMDDTGQLNQSNIYDALKALYLQRPDLFKIGPQPVPTIGQEPEIPRMTKSTWQAMLKDAAQK